MNAFDCIELVCTTINCFCKIQQVFFLHTCACMHVLSSDRPFCGLFVYNLTLHSVLYALQSSTYIYLICFIIKFIGSSPPQNFTFEVLNSTAVEISWSYPDLPNGEIQGYTILYAEFPDDMEILINITLDMTDDTSDQIYVIFDLLPFTQYSFRVRAFSLDENETLTFTHIGIASDEIIIRTDEDGIVA